MSIFDKAKDIAEDLVEKVKDKLDGHGDVPAEDAPGSSPGGGAVTPADVAQAVSDPDLPHPEPPSDDPA